jgi:hypothetical protein
VGVTVGEGVSVGIAVIVEIRDEIGNGEGVIIGEIVFVDWS